MRTPLNERGFFWRKVPAKIFVNRRSFIFNDQAAFLNS